MKKIVFTLVTVSLGLYATNSSAQLFKLDITDYGGLDGNQTFVDFVNSQVQTIEDDINKDLPNAAPDRLMQGMANSSVMAAKGTGTDYASRMDVFLIGASVGVGADLEKQKDPKSDLSGIGVSPGVMFGMNLGFMDTKKILGMDTDRLNIYFNFMNYKLNKVMNDDPTKASSANLDTTSFGFRIRYDWIKGSGSKWLGWGGIKFHTGFQYNKSSITYKSKINEDVSETSGTGETISGTITGDPVANILTTTQSIPLELSTDVQLLYILSLYGGLGADYNFGQAKGTGNLNGSQSTIACTGGACGAGTSIQVQPTANLNTTAKVNPFLFRSFLGVQVNLPYIRIFAQATKAFGNDLIGATAGVKFVY